MTPSFTVIKDVSETLKVFLQSNISELSNPNAIKLDSPAEVNAGGSPRLSLFLYKVRYNKALRNLPSERPSINQKQANPMVLDLMYLMTPFSNNNETEHIIMEKLMLAFYDNSILRAPDLQGALVEQGNEELRIVPDDLSVDEIEKLWTAFPNKAYRLAVPFVVSPVYVPSQRVEEVTRVVERQVIYSIPDEG